MDNLNHDIEEMEKLEEFEMRKASTLAKLLDEKMNHQDKYIALRAEMGKTGFSYGSGTHVPSWIATHTLEWIGKNLKMGSQMPFMKEHIDDHGRIMVSERIAEELKQRAPDWTRQPELAAYLLHDKQRKFSTILAVVCPPWVDDPKNPNWGADGCAVENAIRVEALDTEGKVCLIDLHDTFIYALDGQHRVMGIQGVMAIRDRDRLELRRRDGTFTNKIYERDELMNRFRINTAELQALLTESISVEYIPAVLAGETREEANRRVRDVFVCINSYAKKTKAGENILLDESDGFSIVARRIGTSHSLFKTDSQDRVNWANNNISKASVYFSTLDTIRSIGERYLPGIDDSVYGGWKPMFRDQVPLRPTESDLDRGYDDLSRLFDLAEGMPVFQNLLRGDSVIDAREFPDGKNQNRKGHLMLRPVGQQVFARAISAVMEKGSLSWSDLKYRLERLDDSGVLSLDTPANLWYGILYDPRKGAVIVREGNRETATKLLVYLLESGADGHTRKELLANVISHRQDETRERWMDFNGDWSEKTVDGSDLPTPP